MIRLTLTSGKSVLFEKKTYSFIRSWKDFIEFDDDDIAEFLGDEHVISYKPILFIGDLCLGVKCSSLKKIKIFMDGLRDILSGGTGASMRGLSVIRTLDNVTPSLVWEEFRWGIGTRGSKYISHITHLDEFPEWMGYKSPVGRSEIVDQGRLKECVGIKKMFISFGDGRLDFSSLMGLECLCLNSHVFSTDPVVVLPKGIRKFISVWGYKIANAPVGLRSLSINSPIPGVKLPHTLRKLELGDAVDPSTIEIPPEVEKLSMHGNYPFEKITNLEDLFVRDWRNDTGVIELGPRICRLELHSDSRSRRDLSIRTTSKTLGCVVTHGFTSC